MAGGVVESAAASYQPQSRIAGLSINSFSRELRFEVLAHSGDAENSGDPVRQPYLDQISGTQAAKPEEDSGPPVGIHVPFNERHADLAGRRRVLVPGSLTRRRVQRWHLDRAVGVDPQMQELRVHADGGDVGGYRK